MSFCTAITCMDGRIQLPVNNYLREKFGDNYVDTITEAGPVGIISAGENKYIIEGILKRLQISVNNHGSDNIALVAHHDCAGNPVPFEEQIAHLKKSLLFIKSAYPGQRVIGLWVNENWEVEEID